MSQSISALAVIGALLAAGCVTAAPPRYPIAYRPSRPPDCEVELYDETHPKPEGLVELGRIPATLGFYSPPAALLKAFHERACEAGALALEFETSGHSRPIGGVQRLKDVEVVFLARPAEETVTEATEQISGAAVRDLARRLSGASP